MSPHFCSWISTTIYCRQKLIFKTSQIPEITCPAWQKGIHIIHNQAMPRQKNFPVRNTIQRRTGLKVQDHIFKNNTVACQLDGAPAVQPVLCPRHSLYHSSLWDHHRLHTSTILRLLANSNSCTYCNRTLLPS